MQAFALHDPLGGRRGARRDAGRRQAAWAGGQSLLASMKLGLAAPSRSSTSARSPSQRHPGRSGKVTSAPPPRTPSGGIGDVRRPFPRSPIWPAAS